MTGKVLNVADQFDGVSKKAFQRLIGLMGQLDQNDRDLQKLVAFRLKLDGEDSTRSYLLQKINLARQCNFTGRFFDFLKNDDEEKRCGAKNGSFPDDAG